MKLTALFNSERNRLLMLVATLVFVFTQTIDLQHSHEGDLELQTDCQVCLKLGSQNDVAIANFEHSFATPVEFFVPGNSLKSARRTLVSYKSRAPPLPLA